MIAIDKSTWVVPPCPPGQIRFNYAGPSDPGFCTELSPVIGPVRPIYSLPVAPVVAVPSATPPVQSQPAASPTVLIFLTIGALLLLRAA